MKILRVTAAVALCILALATATTKASLTSEAQIVKEFNKMEAVLNDNKNSEGMINFFHSFIVEDAKFDLRIENPSLPKALQGTSISMGKEEFINSFLQGTYGIEGYQAEIKVEKVIQEQSEITSAYTMIERGTVKDPQDLSKPGQSFQSTTKCMSRHEGEDKHFAIKSSFCKTIVGFEEAA